MVVSKTSIHQVVFTQADGSALDLISILSVRDWPVAAHLARDQRASFFAPVWITKVDEEELQRTLTSLED